MTPTPPDVAVVVPARNAAATIGATLEALANQQVREPFEVIVVDDGSTDDTAAIARRASCRPRIVHSSGRGAAAARNAGARATAARRLAFTDADCQPTPNWLQAGLVALDSADLVQGRVEPIRPLNGPFERTLEVTRATGLFESANLFVHRTAFESVDGFTQWTGRRDERPFGEDSWFGWRLVRSGNRVAFASEAVVRHAVFPGSARDFVREHWRLRYFPPLLKLAPELRSHLYRTWFFSRQTATYDLALLGCAFGLQKQRVAPLLLTIPYVRRTFNQARIWGRRRGLTTASIVVIADTVGAAALLTGSRRARRLVL